MRHDPRKITTGICACGSVVLTADDMGHKLVIDALPLADQDAELAAVLSGRQTYSILAGHLRMRSKIIRESPKQHLAYAAHDCGNVRVKTFKPNTVAAKVDDTPPFDWRPVVCSECRVFFEPDDEYVGIYQSPSQHWAAHAYQCPRPPVRAHILG